MCSRRRRSARIWRISARASSPPEEANASPAYQQMLIESRAEDIVYTSLFSGVAGNYLRGSVLKTGMDPDNLPEGDKTKMNFGTGGNTELKAWKDIWSAGQSVSGIHDVPTVAALVERMVGEYRAAQAHIRQRLGRIVLKHEAPPLRLNSDQLPAALNRGLAPVYLVSGDEPLLVGETADAVRAAARASGYLERTVFFIDRSFDWNELRHATQALSLFAERRLFELRMPSGKPDKGAAQLAEIATQPAAGRGLPDHHRQTRPQDERGAVGARRRTSRRVDSDLAGG